jgi:uncharacterized protein
VKYCSPVTENALATGSHTPKGESGLHYLCAGYKSFFKHINHPMRNMAELLSRGRYADEVMNILAREEMDNSLKKGTNS